MPPLNSYLYFKREGISEKALAIDVKKVGVSRFFTSDAKAFSEIPSRLM